LTSLKSQNLIRTIRGANGGFTIDAAPSSITMLQIVSALEGSIAPVSCVENSESCERSAGCAARKLWQELHNAQVEVLKKTTLQSLLDIEDASKPVDYCI
jgi:Rrf2 family transcriptional regulator, cysteine metabolism repressor